MARPFTYVSSTLYYEIEVYYFRLTLFLDSKEYLELSTKNQIRINREIISIGNLIDAMRMFRQIPSNEKAI